MVSNITVISMVGRTGAGKSTIARKLARYLRCPHIEVSDVIKSIYHENDRAKLAATSSNTKSDPDWLGREIAGAIERKLEDKTRSVVVLSGIREIEVVEYLNNNYTCYEFEVRADVPVRYRRSIEDGKYTTADQFIEGELRELELGLEQVEDHAPYAIPTSPLTNPDRIIKATTKLLREKGADLR